MFPYILSNYSVSFTLLSSLSIEFEGKKKKKKRIKCCIHTHHIFRGGHKHKTMSQFFSVILVEEEINNRNAIFNTFVKDSQKQSC